MTYVIEEAMSNSLDLLDRPIRFVKVSVTNSTTTFLNHAHLGLLSISVTILSKRNMRQR